jgi:two-component system LytT family sensor kinase
MKLWNFNITYDRLFRLLFHILFWGMLIVWPILNSAGNENFRRFVIKMIPVSLTYIPLFLLNTEWIIPRVLRKRGVASYLLALVLLVAGFTALQLGMREWLVRPVRPNDLFFTLVFVLMVTGISTAYGFITDLVDQEKARQEERQERMQSELAFLRSQINPHFIFNILNSIVYLIRTKSGLAETVTIKLSELMRYMLYDSLGEQVPLEHELEYLKNYVELQKIRFEEDVDIRLHIEDTPRGQTIEPMMMIPFVENAFKHGVGMIADPVIEILVQFDEDRLSFTVKNKIGPEPAEDKDPSSGIGLRNVKRRLELLYPGRHRLDIEETEEWFVITLHLEFDKSDNKPSRKKLMNEA